MTETGTVDDGPLLDGAGVGAGLPAAGAVVVMIWPASTGAAGAGVTPASTGAAGDEVTPTGGATTAGLLATDVEAGVGMSSTDFVTMAGCWGMYWTQRPW